MPKITISTTVNSDLETVWNAITNPTDIIQWNHASDDWECPHSENDLRVGGRFLFRMAAKDGSSSFDFNGTYTVVEPLKSYAYVMEDGREVEVLFEETAEGVRVTETFDPENESPEEMQRAGWQAILDNFKKHVESK